MVEPTASESSSRAVRQSSSSPTSRHVGHEGTPVHRGKLVHLYRNGDLFFRGVNVAISPDIYRTFDAFLADISKTKLCDSPHLLHGVRHIFSVDGVPVTRLDQFIDDMPYVCSSTPTFKPADYKKITSRISHSVLPKGTIPPREPWSRSLSRFRPELSALPQLNFIVPRMIYVIRSGPRPRNMGRILLNKRTAQTFDQVLTDIAAVIKMETGTIRLLYTLTGKRVTKLQEFFGDDITFVAFGTENFSADELDMNSVEGRFIYGSSSTRSKILKKKPDSDIELDVMTSRSCNVQSNYDVADSEDCDGEQSQLASSSIIDFIKSNGYSRREHLKVMMRVDRGYAGDDMGIPIPLLAKYKIGKVIAKTDFTVIRQACDKAKVMPSIVLKIVTRSKMNAVQEAMATTELSIIRRLQHPNFLLMLDEVETLSESYLIMEAPQGGNLYDAINKYSEIFGRYSEKVASNIMLHVVRALQYLHSINIVHRNVKPENIMVTQSPDGRKILKLADFGLATEVIGQLMAVCGTPAYMAPEMLSETGYGVKVDVWAAGVILFQLLSGVQLYCGRTSETSETFKNIVSGRLTFKNPSWNFVSNSAKDLIVFMLEEHPNVRSSATDALEHPWIADSIASNLDLSAIVVNSIRQNIACLPVKCNNTAINLLTTISVDKTAERFADYKLANLYANRKKYCEPTLEIAQRPDSPPPRDLKDMKYRTNSPKPNTVYKPTPANKQARSQNGVSVERGEGKKKSSNARCASPRIASVSPHQRAKTLRTCLLDNTPQRAASLQAAGEALSADREAAV